MDTPGIDFPDGAAQVASMNLTRSLVIGLALLPWACGGDQSQPQPEPKPTGAPVVEPQPDKPGTGGGPTAEPTGEGGGKTGEAPPTKPKPSGRPAILMGPSKKIASTFGATPGAVLKLGASNGTITWKIPEFSLGAGYNIEFSIAEAKAIKKKGAAIGDVAIVKITSGDKPAAIKIESRADDFELRWPLGTQQSVNLAIGEANTDDQGDEVKGITWKIIAPKSADTGLKEAYFSLKEVGPIMYLHATAAAPTEGGEAPKK
jgi:hypothetical protein